MKYRIAWLRDKPAPYDKAWVRSIRRDGTFRYTSSPNLAKSWVYRSAPERALAKRSRARLSGLYDSRRFVIESFVNPHDANPVVLPLDELVEHGLI